MSASDKSYADLGCGTGRENRATGCMAMTDHHYLITIGLLHVVFSSDGDFETDSVPKEGSIICVTIQPADDCEWYHRQCRLVLGVTERLAPVILFTSTTEAPDRHQKSYHRSRQRDDRNRQLQDQNSKLHRLITSFRKRRRCRVAGLTPLTKGYSTSTYLKERTNVLMNQKKSTVCSLETSPSLSWKTEYGKAA